MEDHFELAGKSYRSRLIVGTGKYKDFHETQRAVEASGAEIVTVAVRRVNITDHANENLSRLCGSKKIHHSAKHGRMLYRRRGNSNLPFGSRGWGGENGEAGGDRGRKDSFSGHPSNP